MFNGSTTSRNAFSSLVSKNSNFSQDIFSLSDLRPGVFNISKIIFWTLSDAAVDLVKLNDENEVNF